MQVERSKTKSHPLGGEERYGYFLELQNGLLPQSPVKYESTKELASHISSHVSLYVGCKVFLQEKRLGIGGVGCSRLQYQKLYYSLEGFKV